MKKLMSLSLLFLVGATLLVAQDKTKEVTTNINEVTLYLSGVTVTRTGTIDVDPGNTHIIITGLSPKLDSRSIQVGMGTEVNILSVSDNTATSIDPRKLPILNFLKDSIDAVRLEIETERNNEFVLTQEQNLLLTNMKVGGEKGVIVPELEDALALYRKELPEIKRRLLVSSMRQRKLQTQLDTLNNRYNEFRRNNEKSTREVHLSVSVDKKTKVALTIQYYVADAGWAPKYDIRSVKVSDPVTLAYKAEMHQNTGENWDGVKMTLSTNNPMYTPALPRLFTNFVDLNGWYMQNRSVTEEVPQTYGFTYDFKGKSKSLEQPASSGAVINTDISFDVPFAVRLASDNQPMVTEVKKNELPVSYKYFTVPKAECTSFLKAQITGWEDVNLLEGDANLYLEGTFLGKTTIDPNQIEDTLSLYMGKDRRVVVKRTKAKEKSGKNFLGNKITQSVVWEIEVRNTKKEVITVEIQDQIPVSKNDDLEIIKDDLGGADLNPETGLLTWNKTLQPGESVKIRFGFTLKYPKNNSVARKKLQEWRSDNYF
jgi:uncharacterized protein (TIGR02231 family)